LARTGRIRSAASSLTIRDLRKAARMRVSSVGDALATLVSSGQVTKTAAGYQLV
jgi:hypothetical protein